MPQATDSLSSTKTIPDPYGPTPPLTDCLTLKTFYRCYRHGVKLKGSDFQVKKATMNASNLRHSAMLHFNTMLGSVLGRLRTPSPRSKFAGPNQSIRLDLATIFVAIPKTGSNSIRSQFKSEGPYLLRAPHLTIQQLKELWNFWHIRESLHRNHRFPTDPYVVLSDFEVLSASRQSFDKALKFATVRNPFARTLSLYRRREGIQVEKAMSFHEFCERLAFASDTCRWPTRNRNQIDWLIDWDKQVQVVEHVLKVEELSRDLARLTDRFPQISFLEPKWENRNPRSGVSGYQESYTRGARVAVEALFKRDLDAFDYDF